ncbi:hypothetical protein M2160_000902 [Streptomyces sp. SAI-117]|uniref:hypothetical protein n=1 Tax=Streptomyces sp. SAI-117 TaxID=2940546 RepID=UPI002475BE42|nr:hypothetical protein [Streptomyces sp. SAI-117]MDH6565881.1 hypothetical protein [Streptomyces sp. SAI-117]
MVVLPDGRERGDPELLAARMRGLHRSAVAPASVDAFVEGHSMAAPERPAAVVKGAGDA